MKKIIFIIMLAGLGYYFGNSSEFPKAGDPVVDSKIVRYALVVRDGKDLKSLANEGQNTIIEIYAPSCPACKNLDKWTTKMRELRPDVNHQKVNISDGFLRGGLSKKVKAAMKIDAICSTPHIMIIDQQGEILAQDNCKKKLGLQFFYRWIEHEIKQYNKNL